MSRPAQCVALPLLLLGGCVSPPAPPPPAPAAVPPAAYTTAVLPGSYGGAAWRPSAEAQVLVLGGQRCDYRDLRLRCLPPPPPIAAPTPAAEPSGGLRRSAPQINDAVPPLPKRGA